MLKFRRRCNNGWLLRCRTIFDRVASFPISSSFDANLGTRCAPKYDWAPWGCMCVTSARRGLYPGVIVQIHGVAELIMDNHETPRSPRCTAHNRRIGSMLRTAALPPHSRGSTPVYSPGRAHTFVCIDTNRCRPTTGSTRSNTWHIAVALRMSRTPYSPSCNHRSVRRCRRCLHQCRRRSTCPTRLHRRPALPKQVQSRFLSA